MSCTRSLVGFSNPCRAVRTSLFINMQRLYWVARPPGRRLAAYVTDAGLGRRPGPWGWRSPSSLRLCSVGGCRCMAPWPALFSVYLTLADADGRLASAPHDARLNRPRATAWGGAASDMDGRNVPPFSGDDGSRVRFVYPYGGCRIYHVFSGNKIDPGF